MRKHEPSLRQQACRHEMLVQGTPCDHVPAQLACVVVMQTALPKGQHAPIGGHGLVGWQN